MQNLNFPDESGRINRELALSFPYVVYETATVITHLADKVGEGRLGWYVPEPAGFSKSYGGDLGCTF